MGSQASQFFTRISGVASVGLLTYLGEYSAFLVMIAWLSDKLVVQFGLGFEGYAFVGAASGAYLVLSGLVAIPMGHLCDRYGRRLLSVVSCLLASFALASLLLIGTLTDTVGFLLAVAVSLSALGIAHGTYTASTLAYVGDVSGKEDTGKGYGILELVELFGYAFGPLLGGVVAASYGREQTFTFSGLILLVAAGLAYWFMRDPMASGSVRHFPNPSYGVRLSTVPKSGGVGGRGEWAEFILALKDSTIRAVVLTTLVMAIGFQAFYQYVPQYANSLANSIPNFASVPTTSLAFIAAGTSVLMMGPFGFIEDATRRRMPWLVIGLVVGSVSLLVVFIFTTFTVFVLAALIFGVGLSMARVTQAVILAEKTELGNRGSVMGTYHAVEHAGYGLGAVVGGTLAAAFGFSSTFRALSVLLVLAGVAFGIYARRRRIR